MKKWNHIIFCFVLILPVLTLTACPGPDDDDEPACLEQPNMDCDNDGMPNGWENTYGFNPSDPGDADTDSDNDGLTNLEEFQSSTDPTNPDTDGDADLDNSDCEPLNPNVNSSATEGPFGNPTCSDGLDNDCDGLIDASDSDCQPCVPGDSQTCGNCGTQICDATGNWGSCTGEGVCSATATESQSCGNCGTQTRTCNTSCSWEAWGACTGEGVCTPGQTQACTCGTGTQTCTSSCTWTTCAGAECTPGETQSQTCGNCGTQTKTCQANCTWGTWGVCTGEGVCSPSSTQYCGWCGSQTCTSACQWGVCIGEGVCSPGQIDSQPCGMCGTQSRTCTSSCTWPVWGACTGQGVCTPGSTQSCGNCGNQTCNTSCQWGTCTGQGVCSPGQTQTQTCGNCGTQTKTCQANCTWGPWGSCIGEGPCFPGQTQSQGCGNCGGTQSRTCSSSCNWGSWGSCTCSTQSQDCNMGWGSDGCGTQDCSNSTSCNWGSCASTYEDACEVNDDCWGATSIGSFIDVDQWIYIPPDICSSAFIDYYDYTLGGGDWYYLYINDNGLSLGFEVYAKLYNIPSGCDYDLYLFREETTCSNLVLKASSTNGGTTQEVVQWLEQWAIDDSGWYDIWVYPYEGYNCGGSYWLDIHVKQ